jgi:hypothetical protein
MEPGAPPRPIRRRWSWAILAFAVPALILEVIVGVLRSANTPLLLRFGDVGLPLSTACIALLMLLPPKHPLLRWLWLVWLVAFVFWLAGFVLRLKGGL